MSDPVEPAAGAHPSERGFRWTGSAYAMLIAVVLIVLMWAYILSPWSKPEVPTTLHDPAVAVAADRACAAAQAEIATLPVANTAKTPEERAVTLTQANAMVADLIVELKAIESSVPEDQQYLDQWHADWDSYLASRERYATLLAGGGDEPFSVQAEGSHPITERMDGFARLNDMPACQVPPDV